MSDPKPAIGVRIVGEYLRWGGIVGAVLVIPAMLIAWDVIGPFYRSPFDSPAVMGPIGILTSLGCVALGVSVLRGRPWARRVAVAVCFLSAAAAPLFNARSDLAAVAVIGNLVFGLIVLMTLYGDGAKDHFRAP